MASTSYDIVLNGTKAKLKRGVEGSYRKRYVRREIQQQLISQSEDAAVLASREDYARLMQTSWSGGATWWKPIIRSGQTNTYFRSNHMDTWSEPGKIIPTNAVSDASGTSLHDDCVMVAHGSDVYAIGNTSNVNASFLDVYKWTPGSNAFVQETGYHSGIAAADQPVSGVSDGTHVYVLCQDDSTSARQVSRFNPDTPDQDADWYTDTSGLKYGSTIAVARQGLIYTAGGSIFLIDSDGGGDTNIFSDGQIEVLPCPSGGSTMFRTEETMVSTPEGIFYAKNQAKGGQHQAWVWRIDRDEAGNWIGSPLSPLPIGSIALAVFYHLGSLIVAATTDPQAVLNQDSHAEIVLYHYTGGQPGAIGSFLGDRDEIDESPYAMLGARGTLLYIGGHKRLWVYDAARGGVHSVWDWETATTLGPYRAMAWARDSDDDTVMVFSGPNRVAHAKSTQNDDPDTVTNFGDDETHYTLESNFFDFNLPFEEKELSKVEVLHDAIDGDGNQEWTVQIAADGGSFSDVLTNSTADSTYGSADLNGTSGRRFRYRVIYQTKDTDRIPLRGLLVSASGGANVLEYELILDGDELLNVDNEVQNEEDFYDSLVTIAATKTQITFSDNMQEQAQETDTGTTSQMKVRAVEINKNKPGESTIQVVLREA